MTGQRRFKTLVRARMAQTGESYLAARRQLLAKLPEERKQDNGSGVHRESSLIRSLLKDVASEPMIAGLAGGIGFMYFVFEYKGLPPMMTIVAQHHPDPWIPAALGRLGVPSREEHSGKPELALAKLTKALDAGTPAFCVIDRSRLPWHDIGPEYAQDPYWIGVTGRNGDTFRIEEGRGPAHDVDAETLGVAWSGHKKGRHHLLVPTGPPASEPDVVGALKTTVAHLTGPVLGNNFDVNFGFSGMEKLIEQLRDTRTKTGWAKRFGTPEAFAAGARRFYDCFEVEYTAPGGTRPLYAAFLDEIGDFDEAAALFRESGAGFSRVARLAVEVAEELDDAGRREFFGEVATSIESCLNSERRAVEILSSAL